MKLQRRLPDTSRMQRVALAVSVYLRGRTVSADIHDQLDEWHEASLTTRKYIDIAVDKFRSHHFGYFSFTTVTVRDLPGLQVQRRPDSPASRLREKRIISQQHNNNPAYYNTNRAVNRRIAVRIDICPPRPAVV